MSTPPPKSVSKKDANIDPLSGAPGAHPAGAGVGAASGGIAGAVVGAIGGPVGAAVGAAIGGVVGGLTGKAVAELIDPTIEDAYWQDNFRTRPYVESDARFEDYRPAYRAGYEGYTRYPGKRFEEVEKDLASEYETSRGNSPVAWDRAKHAARDAWHKVEKTLPGDADGDGI